MTEVTEREPTGERYEPTEEDKRLVSSDLSDCEEVWLGELGNYMLETQKRKRLVEEYFAQSAVVSGPLFCLVQARTLCKYR